MITPTGNGVAIQGEFALRVDGAILLKDGDVTHDVKEEILKRRLELAGRFPGEELIIESKNAST